MRLSIDRTGQPCSICGEGKLVSRVHETDYEYSGYKGKVPLHFAECDNCGIELTDEAEGTANVRAVMAFEKKVDGLLSGDEILQFRNRYHITQPVAAQLFGGGAIAFSRYENDVVSQSTAMDSLLYLCIHNPRNIRVLAKRRNVILPTKTLKTIDENSYGDIGIFVNSFKDKIDRELRGKLGAVGAKAANDASLDFDRLVRSQVASR